MIYHFYRNMINIIHIAFKIKEKNIFKWMFSIKPLNNNYYVECYLLYNLFYKFDKFCLMKLWWKIRIYLMN